MKLGPCYFTPISHKSHTKFALSWVGAHTDPTHGIALMVGNLTEVSSLLCGGSHKSHSHGIALMVENLTEVSSLLFGGSHRFHSHGIAFDGGKSHGGFFVALRGLTQIQRIQQKIFVKICVVSGCLN